MCGIYGYIGNKKAIPILIDGLKHLEYRGYDSSGIAYVTNKINIVKEKGEVKNLENLIDTNIDTNIGLAHTRWATHGKANKINAHPHKQNKITIVHNGIVENYKELKKQLKEYNFKSETDTEILCALIDKIYNEKKDIIKTLNSLKNIIKGSYSLGIIIDDDLNSIYAIKKDSPLILSQNTVGSFITSDIPAILNYSNKYITLDNNEIAHLTKDKITIYNDKLDIINKDIITYEENKNSYSKNNFEHYMLKEIIEQKEIIKNTINSININELPNLNKYNKIHIVGCGSAYNAGLIGKYLIENYCDIEVKVEVASEYKYKNNFYNKDTLVIFISQSGETIDTLECIKKVKQDKIDTLAIVNVTSSSIAREADKVIYTKAGIEISVASTKAYTSQILILAMIALKTNFKDINIIDSINEVLTNDYIDISKLLSQTSKIFFIGRDLDYATCEEAALKLKEITYINCVAYKAGELKHGPISLIDKNTYVIAINTDKNLSEKMMNNIKEVYSRGAKIIYITTNTLDKIDNFYKEKIIIPTLPILQPILAIIPLQLIAYNVAKIKGCNIDKPRNLAKSVTVE